MRLPEFPMLGLQGARDRRHVWLPWLTRWSVTGLALVVGCAAAGDVASVAVTGGPPMSDMLDGPQVATVSLPFDYDATRAGAAFTDPKGRGLAYTVTFAPSANGLSASNGRVTGVPAAPGVMTVKITAFDAHGDTAAQTFPIVVFSDGLPLPELPARPFAYSDASAPLPAHFLVDTAVFGPAIVADNMPATNPTTDAGAALGRVLFYDRRLSANDQIACASCHQQAFGFSDTARFSAGFKGGHTARHAMGLANARFYELGRFFWDQRAPTLEAQVLMPIQDPVEMGMTLQNLTLKVGVTAYYPPLFQAAFGTPEVTSDRISRAIAQFVRSLVSSNSPFDAAFDPTGLPDLARLGPQGLEGRLLFAGVAGCSACHVSNAVIGDAPHNTGLDSVITDNGAGGGQFKAPSLRNVAARGPYMHDGRFQTLEQVVQFYDSGVHFNSGLDSRLRAPGQTAKRLRLSQSQRDALVSYLRTLTDSAFLTSEKFASPFRSVR